MLLTRKKSYVALVLAIVLFTQSGCMQLFALPIYLVAAVITLPFTILKMVISFLPTLIKLAPVALLFVENSDVSHYEELEMLVANINKSGDACVLTVCELSPTISCYQLQFLNKSAELSELSSYITHVVADRSDARICFTDSAGTRDTLASVWQQMKDQDIVVGCDEKLMRTYEELRQC